VRIIAGKHRGRMLAAPDDDAIRPTADRTRQALFNILVHADAALWGDRAVAGLEGAVVLDAFCGTGALGLEALSRGAARCFLMDSARHSLDLARRNAASLQESEHCRFILADATTPPTAPAAADLAFFDPPYGQGLAPRAMTGLAAAGWLAHGALLVWEQDARETPSYPPPGFTMLQERRYGRARLTLLRYVPALAGG
jgi:16S rRNA (guanine966-N2)-methyltransferase